MGFELSFDIWSAVVWIGRQISGRLGIRESPRPLAEFIKVHDTFYVKGADGTVLISYNRTVRFNSRANSLSLNNPFARSEPCEARLVPGSLRTFIDEVEVPSHPYRPDRDASDVACTLDFDFFPDKTYQIIASARFFDFRPFGPDVRIIREGFAFLTKPYRLNYQPRIPTRDATIEILFLDSSLLSPPVLKVWDSESGSICTSPVDLDKRNLLYNHFLMSKNSPIPGQRHEIIWQMPDRLAMIKAKIALGVLQDEEPLDMLSNALFSKAYLLGPNAIVEARKQVISILVTARSRIVLIDPNLDNSVLELLEDIPEGIEIVFVTRPTASTDLDKQKFQVHLNARKARWVIRTTWSFHDRYIIIDNEHMYSLGGSLKDLADKVCLLHQLSETNPITLGFIVSIYKLCNIKMPASSGQAP